MTNMRRIRLPLIQYRVSLWCRPCHAIPSESSPAVDESGGERESMGFGDEVHR